MRVKKILTIFFCCVSFICCFDEKFKNLVMSFVVSEDKPTALLTPELCWTQFELKSLTRMLFDENISVARSLQRNRTKYYLHHIIILIDLSCPGMESFLIRASDQGYFKSPYRWLILDPDAGAYKFDFLSQLDLPLNSDVVIAKRKDEEFQLIEAYKIAENTTVIYSTRSVWQPSSFYETHQTNNSFTAMQRNEAFLTSGFEYKSSVMSTKYGVLEDLRETPILSTRRKDLRGHTLAMAIVITDSNETRKHMSDRLNLHQDSISKMSYMVVKVCFDMLNATEKRIFTNTWGYRDKNGNWQGIIDLLLKKKADLGTITIFTQERMMIIDYIAMIGPTAVRFVFREPPLAMLANIFALPFTGAVWMAIFVCVLGCAVFLYIASKWEASVSMEDRSYISHDICTLEGIRLICIIPMLMHPLQLDGSWADVLILIIGAVLQQGCTLEPRYAAGRCVTLLLFVALTILYAAYSANIVVLLRAPSSSVRSLPDLLESPVKLGASDFEYNRYFFKKLNDPIRKAIYDKKIAPKGKKPNYYSMKEGVEKIRKGLFAFHMELNPGYRLIQETYQEEEKCDLVEIDYINEIDPWLPGQKNSPYKDLFKVNFAKIRETGVQSNVHRRLQVSKPRCSGSISTFSSVGISDMFPALVATLYGAALALAVLLLEIAYKKLMLLRQKRRTFKNLLT